VRSLLKCKATHLIRCVCGGRRLCIVWTPRKVCLWFKLYLTLLCLLIPTLQMFNYCKADVWALGVLAYHLVLCFAVLAV